MRLDTGGRNAFKWETHREYIDLQYILGGGEVIEWAPAAKLVADVAYDEKTDFQFYAPAEADALLRMQDGLFTFLFPADGHKPLVADGANSHIHKAIAKIHKSLLVI
jgi:YhcH/YjgK/YiaL family protein